MPLTNHTTSLELSIALKKAGWPQEESLFYWVNPPDGSWHLQSDGICGGFDCDVPRAWRDGGEAIASPTASELMERMPPYLIHDYQAYTLTIKRIEAEGVCVMYEAIVADKVTTYLEGFGHDEILPNALAKLALHLIQEGGIKF